LGKDIFSSSSQPWLNNQHFNAYQYIHIRACFFTWGKAQGVPDRLYEHHGGCLISDRIYKNINLPF